MQQLNIGPGEAGQRLDKYLQKYFKAAEKSFLYKMLRKKNITLNGKKAEGNELLGSGDTVSVFFSDETFNKMRGEVQSAPAEAPALPASLGIVYEDRNVMVWNKPAGMLSQKAEASDISLNEYLAAYLHGQGGLTGTFQPGVANRLDRNTSGLVLAGKTLAGQQLLAELLRSRAVEKYYRVLVAGTVSAPGHLVNWLSKEEAGNTVRLYAEAGEGRDRVEIYYKPLACCGGCSQLAVRLVTGKTHQIRAQLAGLGHPVLGDKKYGSPAADRAFSRRYGHVLRHQLLHASLLVFPEKLPEGVSAALSAEARAAFEPLRGRKVSAPLPANFAKCAALLQAETDPDWLKKAVPGGISHAK